MAKVCVQDVAVAEAVHAGPELADIHEDVSDEQLSFHFKQEERSVSFLPKRVAVRMTELLDLPLCEAEFARIAERTEQRLEIAVAGHFVHVDLGLGGVFASDIRAQVFEVTIDPAG